MGPRSLVRAVCHHFDGLERDHSIAQHPIELGQDGADLLLGINRFDHDRQVFGQAQETRGVEVLPGAEALDTPENRGTRQTAFSQALDHRLVERLAMPPIGFTEVYADQ